MTALRFCICKSDIITDSNVSQRYKGVRRYIDEDVRAMKTTAI